MADKKTFEIILIRKIPYITTGLSIIFFFSFSFFLLYSKLFLAFPTSLETKLFYLFHLTPPFEYSFLILSIIVLSFLFYLLAKFKRRGLIIFNPNSFELILKKERQLIPFSSVRRVYCNDSENKKNEPNKKFTMTIETWKNKKLLVRLQNTADINRFIDKLLSFDQLKIEHFSITPVD